MRGLLERLQAGDADIERQLTKGLGVSFSACLLIVIVLSTTPMGSGTQYTEFYVLGPDGTASDYPSNLSVGEPAEFRVGIGNEEGADRTYTLVVGTNQTAFETETVDVAGQQVWERPLTVAFDSPGEKTLHLELYVGEDTDGEPYRSLRLLIDVTA